MDEVAGEIRENRRRSPYLLTSSSGVIDREPDEGVKAVPLDGWQLGHVGEDC